MSCRTKLHVFGGLSCWQGSAHGHSHEFGFGAALKRKAQSRGRYVSAETNFYECVHPEVYNCERLFGILGKISMGSG